MKLDLKEKILESLTIDDIVNLMDRFGVEHEFTENGDLRFQAHCHGKDSKKLYYYETNKQGEDDKGFFCYSNCGGMSVFDAFMKVNSWSFKKTRNYLAEYKNISVIVRREKGFNKKEFELNDWEFINKYKKVKSAKHRDFKLLPNYNKNILNVFNNVYPSSWEDEGITLDAMQKFGVLFSLPQWKAILPHLDYLGNLIGVRGRSFLYWDLEAGKKYMPMYIENESYRHPLGYNLYGLYENIKTIKRLKKVLIVEGEKSVLLSESYYPNENFTVAICGSNMSKYQRDLLIYECEVAEVIIGIDKQFKNSMETEKDQIEYDNYIKKVKKIADQFVNYANVSILYCDDERLEYKMAPTDAGKEILEELMKEKIRYKIESEG